MSGSKAPGSRSAEENRGFRGTGKKEAGIGYGSKVAGEERDYDFFFGLSGLLKR
jgi:hypothetical protein